MNIAVRYYTRSGNTKKLSQAASSALGVEAHDVSVPLSERADILILGCSYYAFDIDDNVKKFIEDNSASIGKIVCIGTSAMMNSMKKPVKKVADMYGIEVADEEFHCRGSFGPMHKGRPNEKDLEKVKAFVKSIM